MSTVSTCLFSRSGIHQTSDVCVIIVFIPAKHFSIFPCLTLFKHLQTTLRLKKKFLEHFKHFWSACLKWKPEKKKKRSPTCFLSQESGPRPARRPGPVVDGQGESVPTLLFLFYSPALMGACPIQARQMETVFVVIALTYPTPTRGAVLEGGLMSPLGKEGNKTMERQKLGAQWFFFLIKSSLLPFSIHFLCFLPPLAFRCTCLSPISCSLWLVPICHWKWLQADGGRPCNVKRWQISRWEQKARSRTELLPWQNTEYIWKLNFLTHQHVHAHSAVWQHDQSHFNFSYDQL